jgi:predicted nucleic-acid-binding protein
MIGLDTNILARYLTHDDPKQFKIADKAIRDAIKDETKLFINHIVLCELVWVLEAGYQYPKSLIVKVLDQMLRTRQFEFEKRSLVHQALEFYRRHPADFADCLIGIKNQDATCEYTITFDRGTKKIKTFRVL